MRKITETFEVVADGKPVRVTATPYTMHTQETRYRVSVNDGPVHIFAWDESHNRITAIQSSRAAGDMPNWLDEAIGNELYGLKAA